MEVINESIISTTKDVVPETEVYEKEPAKIPGYIPNLDICFMLDCTGSMQKYIDRARNKIKDIIEEVKEQYPESEIQVGIVGYRDFDVSDDKRFEIFHFSSNIPSARSFLDNIRAHGGKDYPEDVNGGFQQVLNKLEWSGQAKMIVHIADAPCHGKLFHNAHDTYPDGHKNDMDWELIFKKIVEQHMDYLFLKIQNGTDKMFDKFKEIAEKNGAAANGVLFKQEQIANLDATTTTTTTVAAPTTSLTTTPLFTPKITVTEPEKVSVKPEIIKKEKKETTKAKKTRTPRSEKTPSRSRSRSTKTTKKEKKASRKKVEKEEEEVVSDWAAPAHLTRSKYREYIEHVGKEQKKDGYWTIPQTEVATPKTTRSRSSKKSSTRKPSVSKERSEKRGKKRAEKSTKRKASASKDRERSKERTKKTSTRRDTRSKSKKGSMTVENPLPKRAFIAPQTKTLSKAPVPVMPTSFVGMSAMDEQEYFAKLLSAEMMGSINRRIDMKK